MIFSDCSTSVGTIFTPGRRESSSNFFERVGVSGCKRETITILQIPETHNNPNSKDYYNTPNSEKQFSAH